MPPTIGEIAKRAGVAKGTVYLYYRNKAEIVVNAIAHEERAHIDRLAPQKSKTMGQAVNNAVTYGLGLMVGFFLNGYLYEIMGSFALFSTSSLIAVGGGLMFKGLQMMDRKRIVPEA